MRRRLPTATALVSAAILLAALVAIVGLGQGAHANSGGRSRLAWRLGSGRGHRRSRLWCFCPEGLAALRAAQANRLQTSLNLALGSALASIGLTIPAVAAVSIVLQKPLELGLNAKEQVLLALTLLVGVITLGTGRTTVLQGIIHLVIFAAFLFFALVP